jgi:3-oxoacyl-[acyl-carrier-protein] synthase II
MSASILGIGPVCALGCGVRALREGLEGARRPTIERRDVDIGQGRPFPLGAFTSCADELERFLPKRALRRMDSFVRMALLSAYLAVEDAGIAFPDPERVGVVIGSGYGPLQTTFAFQDSLIDFGDKCASPTHFANSVHNALASQVSISMNLQGPGQTVTTLGLSAAGAFLTAMLWIERDEADFVLVGAGDELCPVRGYAEARMLAEAGMLSEAGVRSGIGGAIRPFLFDACTYAPGEGFVTFLLGKEGAPNGYARVSRVLMGKEALENEGDLVDSLDAVFLAANGNCAESAAYRHLAQKARCTAAYAPFYGSMPTGDAFDIAIAALALKEGRLFPSPDASGAENLAGVVRNGQAKDRNDNKDNKDNKNPNAEVFSGGSIGCLKCDEDGPASLTVLTK